MVALTSFEYKVPHTLSLLVTQDNPQVFISIPIR